MNAVKDFDLFNAVFAGKRVLVTGDTGFKGSWLSIWLRELGADVYGYALPPLSERDNYCRTGLSSRIRHLDGDVRDRKKLLDFFTEVRPDIAFHLAAQPLVLDAYNNPHYNFETNLMGTVNFFEAVRSTASVKAAINVTTDKCYQNREWVWGYRENDPLGGDDPYSASKACSELISHSYLRSYFSAEGSANVASARAGNVIGGGDWAADRIIPDLLRADEQGKEVHIRNPDAVRPWQHVLEPLSGYLRLAQKLFENGKTFSGGWNFGPSAYRNFSVRDVADEMSRYLPDLKVRYQKGAPLRHEAGLLKLDISKAVNFLQWQPKLDFEATIKYTIQGYLDEKAEAGELYKARLAQIAAYCIA